MHTDSAAHQAWFAGVMAGPTKEKGVFHGDGYNYTLLGIDAVSGYFGQSRAVKLDGDVPKGCQVAFVGAHPRVAPPALLEAEAAGGPYAIILLRSVGGGVWA